MEQCETCGLPPPDPDLDPWKLIVAAAKVYHRVWLEAQAARDQRIEYRDRRTRDLLLFPPPHEPRPALTQLAERKPEVAWLALLPAEELAWWRQFSPALDWLVRTYPHVTEREWTLIFR